MNRLFLSSSGLRSNIIVKEFLKILPKAPSETKLTHIYTAAKVQSDKLFMEKDRIAFKDLGFQITEVDIESKTREELRTILQNQDVIYMQGGNGFYLLKHLRESGLDKLIPELLDKGIIYFGTSAGTYVACPTIEMHQWKSTKDTFGLDSWDGLKLVPFLVVAHYEDKNYNDVKEGIKSTKYPVKILTDDQAILVQGDEYKLIGEGNEIIL